MTEISSIESQAAANEVGRNISKENLRRASQASVIGTIIEYYDYALYGMASALIFGQLFFPALGPAAGLIASFATLAIGFIVRPLGAIFFGVLGDRLGRKFVLIATISLMGASSTLMGLLPTSAQADVLAPALLILLRLLQGLGAGAEQAGVAILMTEYAPAEKRGYYASLPFIGIPGGLLLASGAYVWLGTLDHSVLLGGAWRIPFLASVVLLIVALFIRYRLQESPTFVKLEARDVVVEHPVKQLLRTSKPSLLRGIGLRIAENGNSYIYYTLTLSYITSVKGLSAALGSLAIVLGCLIGLVCVPFFGWLSDKYGRVPLSRYACLGMILFAFPAWFCLSTGDVTLCVAVIAIGIGIGIPSMLGPQVSLLPEMFGSQNRYLGVAVAREFSAIISGGIAPMVGSILLYYTGNAWWSVACYVGGMSLVGFITTFFTPETRGRDLSLIEDAR
jgi:MFS transporter, MHS family, metabolite:H+ symporter